MAEDGREPADSAVGLPFEQQQPQFRTLFQRGVHEFANPRAKLLRPAGGVIEDDENRLIPSPLLDAVLFAKPVELVRCREARKPALLHDLARKLQRQPRLAPPARADEDANRDRSFAREPSAEIGHCDLSADQRDDVGAIGAEQRGLGIVPRRKFCPPLVLGEAKIGLGPNGHVHAAAARLNDNVVVAEDACALGRRIHRALREGANITPD